MLVFKLLIKHFGPNYKAISDEMNKTLFNKIYRPSYIKILYEAENPVNLPSITREEANMIF